MTDDLDPLLARFDCNAPATSAEVQMAERQLGVQLPLDYVEFVKRSNGGEGFIGNGAYAVLWPVNELASMNAAYGIEQYLAGLLVFGSDGGGEAFGFDTRDPRWPIVQVPFIGMDWNLAEPMGANFNEFLQRLDEVR